MYIYESYASFIEIEAGLMNGVHLHLYFYEKIASLTEMST